MWTLARWRAAIQFFVEESQLFAFEPLWCEDFRTAYKPGTDGQTDDC